MVIMFSISFENWISSTYSKNWKLFFSPKRIKRKTFEILNFNLKIRYFKVSSLCQFVNMRIQLDFYMKNSSIRTLVQKTFLNSISWSQIVGTNFFETDVKLWRKLCDFRSLLKVDLYIFKKTLQTWRRDTWWSESSVSRDCWELNSIFVWKFLHLRYVSKYFVNPIFWK